MRVRLSVVMRVGCQILIAILQGALFAWVGAAPLVWILRDGLGPDAVDSGWGLSIVKFLVMWALPGLALAVPLFGLSRVERRLARSAKPP